MFISKELNMLELRFFFLMEVFYVWSLNIQLGIMEQRVMLHGEKKCVCTQTHFRMEKSDVLK